MARLARVVVPGVARHVAQRDRNSAYEYDVCGNRTKLTYPDASYVTYGYDELNRLTYVRNQAGTALAHYSYDGRSRRTGLTYPNGAGIAYSYDAASRLLYIDNQTNSGQHKYEYTYDKVGNRMDMTVTSPSGVGVHLYDYDKIYQVTEVDYPDELDYLATDSTFNYDDAGNRTSVIDGSDTTPYSTNSLNQYTAAGGVNYAYDTSGNMTYDGHYTYGYDPQNRLTKVKQSGGPALDVADGVDSLLTFTQGGGGWSWTAGGQYGGDSAKNYYVSNEEDAWMQTQVEGAGTFKFWWKVSSESGADYLEFYIDDQLQSGSISGTGGDWAEKTYTLGTGSHTLRWRYVKDASGDDGEDCGWVDHVQWSGPIAEPPTDAWRTLTYTYDAAGRRIEKRYDDTLVLKYIYDGGNCIAEYDSANNLRRKYIFGPAVDEPICMIEGATTEYYHFDGLGSIIALTDASGNTTQVYEYDVYGKVGATDENHTNRLMFTGREFDKETGLYYCRARYYNAEIGRFLQTDPIGYGDGLNWYRYCGNNSVNRIDPSGLAGTHRKVCIYIEVPGLPPGFPSKIAESINDWEYIRVAGDVDQIIAEIGTLDALYGSGEDTYELSFQGGIPNAWSFGDDPKKNILSPSDENPIVQILRAIDPNKVTKVDWRNIIVPDKGNVSQLDEVLKYSGTTIENTFVVDLHLNCPISPVDGGRLVIYDTGKPRGYELVNPAPGAPNADYDIWGAVYSFKPGQEPEEIWKYMTGNSDRAKSNNAKQPY